MKKLNRSGFSAIETLLVLVLLAILGFTGYYVYHAQYNANKTLDTADKTAASQTQAIQRKNSPTDKNRLVISEWDVALALTPPISAADYHLSAPTAWLSTTTLDKDLTCFRAKEAQQTYAGIVRYRATDQVDVLDNPKPGDNFMTAPQAASVVPDDYKQVGDYVYFLDQGNGFACKAETPAQVNAFAKAFATIAKE